MRDSALLERTRLFLAIDRRRCRAVHNVRDLWARLTTRCFGTW
jgi:hypothetical protein